MIKEIFIPCNENMHWLEQLRDRSKKIKKAIALHEQEGWRVLRIEGGEIVFKKKEV